MNLSLVRLRPVLYSSKESASPATVFNSLDNEVPGSRTEMNWVRFSSLLLYELARSVDHCTRKASSKSEGSLAVSAEKSAISLTVSAWTKQGTRGSLEVQDINIYSLRRSAREVAP